MTAASPNKRLKPSPELPEAIAFLKDGRLDCFKILKQLTLNKPFTLSSKNIQWNAGDEMTAARYVLDEKDKNKVLYHLLVLNSFQVKTLCARSMT